MSPRNLASSILLAAVLPALGGPAHASESLITDGFFESYPADSWIASQRGWTVGGADADTSLIVSTAERYEGEQSLLIADRSPAQRPRAIYNLSQPLAAGTVSLAIKEDQSDGDEADAWNVTFGTFALVKDGANFALAYFGGGPGTSPFPKSIAIRNTGYDKTGWNIITISFRKDAGLLTVSINGKNVEALGVANTNYQWGGEQLAVGTFSSSGGSDILYVDALSIAASTAAP